MPKQARNAEYTKQYNRKLALKLLRTAPMSRADLARHLKVTRATTTLIIDEFSNEELVDERPKETTQMGRTPLLLYLRPGMKYAGGVYLNREGCQVGIVDLCGKLVIQEQVLFNMQQNKLDILAETLRYMARQADIPWEKFVGVGVSAPGPLDGEEGRILNPPRFDLWHNTQVSSVLEQSLDLPVYLENNACCLARYNLGKPEAGNSQNFMLLLVDSGIGSGIISGGKLLKGAKYFTAELGHTSIDYRGKFCACGNVGCLETYAAIPNILQGSGFESWKAVMDAFDTDPKAREIVEWETEYLAAGICNMSNIVSMDRVLLAGDLLYGVGILAPFLEKKVNQRSLHREVLPISICPACAGTESHVKAAAEVAFARYLMV